MTEFIWHESMDNLDRMEKENIQALVPEGHVPRVTSLPAPNQTIDSYIEDLLKLKADGAVAVIRDFSWRNLPTRVVGSRPETDEEKRERIKRSERAKAAAERRKLKQVEKKRAELEKLLGEFDLDPKEVLGG